ncbi:hypothetical protein QYM36_005257 [Artemia franciscana]|uniref:BZIP domain-containing protein n=1 Tax=Artemia franciscana TaxID=6661 RepID=A0AA88LBV3_ARTSF|nr:hypothetical protein QYM36_005257 [Artemia franciscana]
MQVEMSEEGSLEVQTNRAYNTRSSNRMKSLRFQYKLDDDELEKDLSSVYDLTDLEDSEDEWKPPKGDDEDYSDDEFDSVCTNEDRLRIAHYLNNELESMPKSKKKKTKAAEVKSQNRKRNSKLNYGEKRNRNAKAAKEMRERKKLYIEALKQNVIEYENSIAELEKQISYYKLQLKGC